MSDVLPPASSPPPAGSNPGPLTPPPAHPPASPVSAYPAPPPRPAGPFALRWRGRYLPPSTSNALVGLCVMLCLVVGLSLYRFLRDRPATVTPAPIVDATPPPVTPLRSPHSGFAPRLSADSGNESRSNSPTGSLSGSASSPETAPRGGTAPGRGTTSSGGAGAPIEREPARPSSTVAPQPAAAPSTSLGAAPVPPPQIADFRALSPEIQPGESSVLHWRVSGAVSRVTVTPTLNSVPAAGEQEVRPDRTTQYTLEADGPGGSTTQPLVVRVLAPQKPSISFSADQTQIKLGQSTSLRWSVAGATRTSIEPVPGASEPSGNFTIRPLGTTRYTLTAEGPGGTSSRSVTVLIAGVAGPSSGELIWTGELSGEQLIAINHGTADFGQLQGALPGLPCIVQPSDERKVSVASAPSPANNFDRLVLRARGKGTTRIVVRWSLQ